MTVHSEVATGMGTGGLHGVGPGPHQGGARAGHRGAAGPRETDDAA